MAELTKQVIEPPKKAVKLALVSGATLASTAVPIAFASADNDHIDQHFGSAKQFAIYEVTKTSAQLTAVVEFPAGAKGHDVNKLQLRIDALTNCAAIYCNAIGSSAVRQLLSLGIKPVTVDLGTEIKTEIKNLTEQWQQQPNHWLQKFCQKLADHSHDSSTGAEAERLASLLAEDWEP